MESFLDKVVLGHTYWFVSALIVSELLILILLLGRFKSICTYLGASLVFYFIGILIQNNTSFTPWYIEKGLVATVFLTLGGLYTKVEHIVQGRNRTRLTTCLLTVAYILLLNLRRNSYGVLISTNSLTVSGILISIISILLLINICKLLADYCQLYVFCPGLVKIRYLSTLFVEQFRKC